MSESKSLDNSENSATKIEDNELLSCDDSVPLFSFKGLRTKAKIVRIYDGDTFWAVFRYHGKFIKVKCRSLGYNSPELKPKKRDFESEQEREKEIERGIAAKKYFEDLIKPEQQLVVLEFFDFDNFGRVLTNIYVSNSSTSINELMSSWHNN